MGPAPSLGTYQAAANAIYQPLQVAEANTINSTKQQTINTLESGKGQIATDYQSAIDQLTQSVQDQSGKINQLYSERLGGNFSGLQGNDMGQMFSRANQQQGIIEQTRANKLAQITTAEDNATIQAKTDLSNLGSKYASLESQYANNAYGSAVKEYNTQLMELAKMNQSQFNSDRSYNLEVAKLNQSGANRANAEAGKYQVSQFKSGNKAYKGPNGQINLYQYAAGVNNGDAAGTWNTILQELSTGSTTDQAAYHAVTTGAYSRGSMQDKINYLQKYHGYIFN